MSKERDEELLRQMKELQKKFDELQKDVRAIPAYPVYPTWRWIPVYPPQPWSPIYPSPWIWPSGSSTITCTNTNQIIP